MTPAEWAERTAQAQDLPATVEDQAVLARIVALLLNGSDPDRTSRGHREIPGQGQPEDTRGAA